MTKVDKLAAEKLIVYEAFATASKAASDLIFKNPDVWYPCGFSWVIIKPARGKIVQALKELGLGRTSDEGGFMVYNPSRNDTQWMNAKEAGSDAFATVLQKHGVNAVVRSRID